MQDRYMVRDDTLDPLHPQHPRRTVFRVYDRKTQTYSQSYYLSFETATKIVENKNGKVNS